MQSNLSTLILTLTIASVLSGCASSVPLTSSATTTATTAGVQAPWQITAQRNLGCYLGAQVPFYQNCPTQTGYCKGLFFVVPTGATRLNLTLVYASEVINTTTGSTGGMGFGARAPSGDPWVDYPQGSLSDPVGTAIDQQRMADNPKRLSFDNPEAGKWRVYSFTRGFENQQLGNFTIDLNGVSTHPPASLEIEMVGVSASHPCS